ncbi:accessory gene regulator B family protein [Bacillus sp. JCM 19041]|uniref:accessory gene regulator ArgB-like protein n=1 Tax=Bacillus sp. JCM 19041 TaxID=1460637 RepID=UPI0018D14AA0
MISNQITDYVIKHVPEYRLNKDNIRYGIEWITSLTIQIAIVLIIAASMGVFNEATITLLTGAILRTFGGGAHFKSYFKCVIYSSFIIIFISYLAQKYVHLSFSSILIIYILSMFIYFRKAPVLHKTKSLFNKKKKYLFKNISLTFITLLFIITIFFSSNENPIITCIWISVLFQSVSLTNGHHIVTDWLDKRTSREEKYL